MAYFDFRMEDPNSHHFQEGTIEAEDKKEAEEFLLTRQQKAADYRLSTDDIAALCKEVYPTDEDACNKLAEKLVNESISMDGFYDLPGRLRAAIATHHQAKPYAITMLKKGG
jgi:hypothetical protein